MSALTEKEGPRAGSQSFSRTLPAFCAGILLAAWMGAVVWTMWRNWGMDPEQIVNLWDDAGIGTAMTFARDLLFVTVLPYMSAKLGKIGQRNGSKE